MKQGHILAEGQVWEERCLGGGRNQLTMVKNLSGEEHGSSEGQAEGLGLSSVGAGYTDLQPLSLCSPEVSASLSTSVLRTPD